MEVLLFLQSRNRLDHRLPPVAGCTHGQRGPVGDKSVLSEMGGQRARRIVHPPKIRLPRLVINEKRNDEDNSVSAGNRFFIRRSRTQTP